MENLAQLHAKLGRTQAEIEKGIAHLIKQRARVAHRFGESEDVTQSRELLATRNSRRYPTAPRSASRPTEEKAGLDAAGNKASSCAIPAYGRLTIGHALLD